MKDLLPLKEAIYEMGLFFNQAPGDDRITAYAKALSNYTPQQVVYAFKQIINSGSAFFPSLAEVLKHLRPVEPSSEDIGNFVANEVIQKVIEFGYYRIGEAYNALSEISRKTIGENRYLLTEIANSERDQLPSIRAQIRGMVKSSAEAIKSGKKNQELASLGVNTENVIQLSDKKPQMRSLDFSELLPQDLA